MNIFLSYASQQRSLAEEIQLALSAYGHRVFFDRSNLSPAWEYHAEIRKAVEASDAFIFLISPESVTRGRYALTEVKFAREKWPHPMGHVLPVMVIQTDLKRIPSYLRAVTILEPEGNIAAEVAAELESWDRGPGITRPVITVDDLKLLFARTLGVPDEYDFRDRILSAEADKVQTEIQEELESFANRQITNHLQRLSKRRADTPPSAIDTELDELKELLREEGNEHDIRHPGDVNITGTWITRDSDTGRGNRVTYQLIQDPDGVWIKQTHPKIGLTLMGQGVIDESGSLKIWYRTITGANGELTLKIPDFIVRHEGVRILQGRFDSGFGIRGDLVIVR